MRHIQLAILFVIFSASLGRADIRVELSSAFLARGEKAVLEIRVSGNQVDRTPRVPEVKGLKIEAIGEGQPLLMPGRSIEFSYHYLLASYEVGVHEIPPIEVLVHGEVKRSESIFVEIFDPSDLVWSQAESQPLELSETVRYASMFAIPKKKMFENQTFASELKIYVPKSLASAVIDWGVPEFEREGLAVWRYEPSKQPGEVNLLGQPYVSLAYKTTMSAMNFGEVQMGPATVRLTHGKTIFNRFAQRIQMQTTLDIAKTRFEILPLPKGAPEGFDNAVGQFRMETAIKETEVREGEPISLDVIVSGAGNLDNLRSPQIIDQKGWKIYDATAKTRGEERRELNGQVVFSQFIRPLEMKNGIPPYRLVFFDPEEEIYKTVTSEFIPLKMIKALPAEKKRDEAKLENAPVPAERMSDILGLLNEKQVFYEPPPEIPFWMLHYIGGAMSLYLLFRAFWRRYGHKWESNETKRSFQKEFKLMEKRLPDQELEFLKVVGSFIEKWRLDEKNQEVSSLIQQRDQLCYQPQKTSKILSKKQRSHILDIVRKTSIFSIFCTLFTLSIISSDAKETGAEAHQAYQEAQFEKAAKIWLESSSYEKISPDVLYNIGNAAYRMGEPGQAALYYRRSISRDFNHQEAQQNLRFIEKKYGSITIVRPKYQDFIAQISHAAWKMILFSGLWVLTLSLLTFAATRSISRWRAWAIAGLFLAPILLSFGALGLYYFPDDAHYAFVSKQAVVTTDKVVLHTDAARTSPEIIDTPPGSVVEVLRLSGTWAYVSLATKTRGWLPVSTIEMIIPHSPPKPPKVRKSKLEGGSA